MVPIIVVGGFLNLESVERTTMTWFWWLMGLLVHFWVVLLGYPLWVSSELVSVMLWSPLMGCNALLAWWVVALGVLLSVGVFVLLVRNTPKWNYVNVVRCNRFDGKWRNKRQLSSLWSLQEWIHYLESWLFCGDIFCTIFIAWHYDVVCWQEFVSCCLSLLSRIDSMKYIFGGEFATLTCLPL